MCLVFFRRLLGWGDILKNVPSTHFTPHGVSSVEHAPQQYVVHWKWLFLRANKVHVPSDFCL